ncbi:hypothetical protein BFJ71_g16128 [Fusarium oxysporum]|nr:hypothetical protein BFJ71_g16128 [Fusarium oxysporum]
MTETHTLFASMHLGDLGKTIKTSVQNKGFLGWQYNIIGVSDGITIGMRFSLQSREIIADSIKTMTCAQAHDACIVVPGCDKNIPGCVMGIIRHNRPSVFVYGGTQRGGFSKLLKRPIDINTPSEARGAYMLGMIKDWLKDGNASLDEIISDIKKNSVPGPGACGGMYTANSLATVVETLGLSVPGSSSAPASSPTNCESVAELAGLLDGSIMTVTGKTLAENVESWPSLPQGQEVIRSLDNPIKASGHIEILRGNIAPGGAVAKITGKEGTRFIGKAMVFNKESFLCTALDQGKVPHNENVVLVVRYEGPKGGLGIPEQLRASGILKGGGYTNVALITDG